MVYQPLPSVWAPAVLTLALLAAVYLGAGAAYRIKKLGKRGTAALPHAAFFQELQGLVADGVALVRGRRGYSQVGSGEGKGESSAKRSRGKKEKAGQKKERRPEPEPEPARHRKSSRERRDAPAPPGPSTAEGGGESEAGAAKSAAAGGGGRWVHVAN